MKNDLVANYLRSLRGGPSTSPAPSTPHTSLAEAFAEGYMAGREDKRYKDLLYSARDPFEAAMTTVETASAILGLTPELMLSQLLTARLEIGRATVEDTVSVPLKFPESASVEDPEDILRRHGIAPPAAPLTEEQNVFVPMTFKEVTDPTFDMKGNARDGRESGR